MALLLAFSGKLGSGKSEGAKQTRRISGLEEAEEHAFARDVKNIAAVYTGTTLEEQYTEKTKNTCIWDLDENYEKGIETRPLQLLAVLTGKDIESLRRGDFDNQTDPTYGRTYYNLQNDFTKYYIQNFVKGQESWKTFRSCRKWAPHFIFVIVLYFCLFWDWLMRLLGFKMGFPPNFTCGSLQQHVGMHFRNVYGSNIWAKIGVRGYNPKKDIWVFTDLRFPEEVEEVRKLGGFLIRLEGDPMGVRARSTRNLNHISETALDDYTGWDLVIKNDTPDLDRFRDKIKAFLKEKGVIPKHKRSTSIDDVWCS